MQRNDKNTLGVLLELNPMLGYHLQIARGIARFRATRSHWNFLEGLSEQRYGNLPFDLVGAIGQIRASDEATRSYRRLGIQHRVSTSNRDAGPFLWPQVISDDEAVGRMAARYFLRKRFQRFAVVGFRDLLFSKERADGFIEELHAHGQKDVHVLMMHDRLRMETLAPLFPLALFAVTDTAARSFLLFAMEAGIRVPEDLAVLGVDNDERVELFSPVPLSSIQIAGEAIGFKACEVLEEMIQTGGVTQKIYRLPPVGVIERHSTEIIAVEDALVRRVQDYLDTHLAEIEGMTDVAAALNLHRRSLDRRFIAAVGITPADWLARRRVERAEKLLLETDYTVDDIAERVGLHERRRLAMTFRKFSRPMPSVLRKAGR
ncbi:MAG: substrate-binding domain-containing protein [Verrucomicrobia bacterium]|nr:substrate-binding domain-containing protein [Verrucomicrobiota bacterium]MCH8526019.1 substrate-binding domain-containing protein [Kiritimatiellia bacterium]